jgi:acyl carrier protein
MAETHRAITNKESKLRKILSMGILEIPADFDISADLFEAGLDSMSIMHLLIQIENAFGCRVAIAQVNRENFSTISKIAALIPAE